MTTEHSLKGPEEQLLGEIEARIVGMQYYEAELEPGEQINLERETDNPHDEWAIRVENRRFEPVGHLPRQVSSWVAPLIDAGKLRVEGHLPETAEAGHDTCPITLTAFLCKKGRHLLDRTELQSKLGALHEVVRRAYEDAQGYADPDLILGLPRCIR